MILDKILTIRDGPDIVKNIMEIMIMDVFQFGRYSVKFAGFQFHSSTCNSEY